MPITFKPSRNFNASLLKLNFDNFSFSGLQENSY